MMTGTRRNTHETPHSSKCFSGDFGAPAFAGQLFCSYRNNNPGWYCANWGGGECHHKSNIRFEPQQQQCFCVDGNANTVIATVTVGNSPGGIGLNAITNMIYVANSIGNSVSVIDGSSNTVVATISGMSFPLRVAVNATTNLIYVTNYTSNNVAVIDGTSNTYSHVGVGRQ